MSLITVGIVVGLAWIFISVLGMSAAPEERNDINSDGTNTLLSAVGYMAVMYALFYDLLRLHNHQQMYLHKPNKCKF